MSGSDSEEEEEKLFRAPLFQHLNLKRRLATRPKLTREPYREHQELESVEGGQGPKTCLIYPIASLSKEVPSVPAMYRSLAQLAANHAYTGCIKHSC